MAVKQEIKSQLARLLATEDLVVEHKHVTTAQFNVHTRVLILPLWERISHTAYDMLVGHEVGHALFTPDVDWSLDLKVPQQFVNVVEDARIEKLMKRKYLGLAKTFFNGYKELQEKDFFELDGEDISSFNLADRANLYFKVGHFLDLAFLPAEKEIIDMIGRCETFDDTKKAAFVLYQYCLEQQKKEQEQKVKNHEQAKMFYDECMENAGVEEPLPFEDNEMSDAWDEAPEVQTVDTLESKLEEMADTAGGENEYIEIPKVDLSKVIVSNAEVHEEIDNDWVYQQQHFTLNPFIEVDEQYVQFKQDAQKEVSYLVKEFECKKAASAYARSTTSKTGILDTSSLHEYKFSEDLFKKITVLPDGKNHGLVFVLDWSGSMQYVLQDTLKQLYNLMWFCRKVQIPFEVYAFTEEWNDGTLHREQELCYEKREGVFQIEEKFNLMNLFTSKVNGKTLDHQMNNVWRIATSFKVPTHYSFPQRLILSGTPLNESLVCLHQILPQFQKESGVEKVHCIVLTDGEGNILPYHREVQRHWEDEPYLGTRNINPNKCFLRDRKLGKVYKFGWAWHQFTDLILENLKDNFPKVNFIGIRVLPSRDARSFMKLYGITERLEREWKRNKSFTIKNSGYDAYFAMSSTVLAEDAEFKVDEDATKAQIKRAFVKSLKTKKLNKKVLGEFVELVA